MTDCGQQSKAQLDKAPGTKPRGQSPGDKAPGTKAPGTKATIEQAARKVNVEENVDLHDGEHAEETGDNDDDYDSVHVDDTDGDDNNDCDDNERYDGRSKDHDVVLQEVESSSEEEENDDDDEQEVNDIADTYGKFCSKVGRRVTTSRSRRFFRDSD